MKEEKTMDNKTLHMQGVAEMFCGGENEITCHRYTKRNNR